ncbi:MAG TPA: hypothetical protein PKV80_28375, partial [Leptospiraceae bacterium]|nr:hypothetical protein [Leptospiraceae bacterium]
RLLENEYLTHLFREPLVFHCNHYNIFLQRTIEDAGDYIPAEKILTEGALVSVYSMLRNLFIANQHLKNPTDRLKVASSIYSLLGFGLLPLEDLDQNGGTLQTRVTHYSLAWKQKWGKRDKPVDYFTCGYIAAALAAAFFRHPGTYSVLQTQCLSMGDEINTFISEPRENFLQIINSPGIGVTIQNADHRRPIKSNINEDLIVKTLRTIPLEGNEEGLIPAFGVYLTRHFANYYNYISFETERAITAATGQDSLANDLFTEAGHVCAFNTFGGIMSSDEWDGLIKPQCSTREDWVSGITACVNALGWGVWTVQELIPKKKLVLRVDGGYESNGYLGFYGKASHPKSFLANGGAAGIMNLLYHGDITEKPKLNEDYYGKLFRSEESFLSHQTKCRASGNDHCEFEVGKVKF